MDGAPDDMLLRCHMSKQIPRADSLGHQPMQENQSTGYDLDKSVPNTKKLFVTRSVAAQVFLAMSLLFFGGWRSSAGEETQLEKDAAASLEVRLTTPPRWEKDCLVVTLDRINHSSAPLFLPKMGPYFYIALDLSAGGASESIEWINVYGEQDIVSSEAVSLEPGSKVRNSFCFGPSVWVVNLDKKTRREIPVRGKLRVDIPYFSSRESWKTSGRWYLDAHSFLKQKGESHDPTAAIGPTWKRIFVAIPCSNTTCKSGCEGPPLGLPGEFRPVPDAFYLDPKWNERGNVITDELAHKSAPCAEYNSPPQRN
jgi:hypothetical protein